MSKGESANPFVRYRWLLDSYRRAIAIGWTDDQFVELVERLDRSVQDVDGIGFTLTPLTNEPRLAAGLGLSGRLWVKDETGNVSASHKGRHLFGTLLDLSVTGATEGELVIASCGNAALAAAVVAKAAERPLRVFIPTWADPAIVAKLETLGATIDIRPRVAGILGDPTVAALQQAIAAGAVPFSVQGSITSSAVDGGRTLGWEAAEQLALARAQGTLGVFIQVGGGALAAAAWQGLGDGIREQWLSVTPTLHTVQTEAAAPLNRAWSLVKRRGLDEAAGAPGEFMWPWEDVGTSAATASSTMSPTTGGR